MAGEHLTRFPGWIASVPINNPEAAMAEADRAVKQLGACGIQIYTNVNGRPLDEPQTLQVIEHIAAIESHLAAPHPTDDDRGLPK